MPQTGGRTACLYNIHSFLQSLPTFRPSLLLLHNMSSEKGPEKTAETRMEEQAKIAREPPTSDVNELRRRLAKDPRFNPPTPSYWKRVALIIVVILLFYVALKMRVALAKSRPPQVIYANRYSKEYKFRPAASPIVTEKLKDGRVKVRGAHPTIR
ncbi:hypothetical protein BXZ70DRAFT_362498 [Cristinia sonorae]|uniref:Uncharacterized protein n=1 Tax=Cristinia sonorae TaxID=1940300 RepID=A0A8K0UJB6_9AGAR|nr:hypothetical protein BXZ70DRAFT_362498 [Cristinia sonorae]